MQTDLMIRKATPADAAELLEIYIPYITDTAITFEYDIPSVSEFTDRMIQTLKKYPYLVAIAEGKIIGYAYASAYKARAAYSWAVETSIYLRPDCKGKGYGKKLYQALEDTLQRQNIININACIAYTTVEDAHLNNTSALFHEHLGYKKVAHFTKCGYKFGTWYDIIWMEKMLGDHPAQPQQVIPFTELTML